VTVEAALAAKPLALRAVVDDEQGRPTETLIRFILEGKD
jgi:hypothetical protein